MSTYSLQKVSQLVDLPIRTIRFYIQKGLVNRPDGARKSATYSDIHIEQCLKVKKWSAAGLSLDKIAAALTEPPLELPARKKEPGEISLVSHINIAEGIELCIDANTSTMSQEKIRELANHLIQYLESEK